MHRRLIPTSSMPLSIVVVLLLLAISSVPFSYSSSTATTSISSCSQFQYDPTTQYPTPSIIRDGFLPFITKKWNAAQSIALLEQAVEDHNAEYIAESSNPIDAICYRRCIVLPLDERFDPPMGVFSHGHVDTGDKMSLNRNFWDAITRTKAEVSVVEKVDVYSYWYLFSVHSRLFYVCLYLTIYYS